MCAPYAPPATLRSLVQTYQRTGQLPELLTTILVKIAEGVWDRYRPTADRQEFAQEVFCHVLEKRVLDKIDPAKNCFSYLTTAARNYGCKLRDKEAGRLKRERGYRDLVRAGGLAGQQDVEALRPELRTAYLRFAEGDLPAAREAALKGAGYTAGERRHFLAAVCPGS